MRGLQLWPIGLIALLLSIAATAQTSGNTVASSKAQDDSRAATANTMKPTECAGITLTDTFNGSGIFTSGTTSELVTGSNAGDVISSGNGDDCVLGGDGGDTINGGTGTDVCIGGPGIDTFINCETQIQ